MANTHTSQNLISNISAINNDNNNEVNDEINDKTNDETVVDSLLNKDTLSNIQTHRRKKTKK